MSDNILINAYKGHAVIELLEQITNYKILHLWKVISKMRIFFPLACLKLWVFQERLTPLGSAKSTEKNKKCENTAHFISLYVPMAETMAQMSKTQDSYRSWRHCVTLSWQDKKGQIILTQHNDKSTCSTNRTAETCRFFYLHRTWTSDSDTCTQVVLQNIEKVSFKLQVLGVAPKSIKNFQTFWYP